MTQKLHTVLYEKTPAAVLEESGTFSNSVRAKEQSPRRTRMPRAQDGQMGSGDWRGNND